MKYLTDKGIDLTTSTIAAVGSACSGNPVGTIAVAGFLGLIYAKLAGLYHQFIPRGPGINPFTGTPFVESHYGLTQYLQEKNITMDTFLEFRRLVT